MSEQNDEGDEAFAPCHSGHQGRFLKRVMPHYKGHYFCCVLCRNDYIRERIRRNEKEYAEALKQLGKPPWKLHR